MRRTLTIALMTGAMTLSLSDRVGVASAAVEARAPLPVQSAYAEASRTAEVLKAFKAGAMTENGDCIADVGAPDFAKAEFHQAGMVPGDLAHRWIVRHRVARCNLGEPYATLFVGISAIERGETLNIAAPINIVNAAARQKGENPAVTDIAVKWLAKNVSATGGGWRAAMTFSYTITDAPSFKRANRTIRTQIQETFSAADPDNAPKPMSWALVVARSAPADIEMDEINVPSFGPR